MTLDATYYKVRIDGVVRHCATLIAHGIRRDDGKRMILGVSCALSEVEVHWRGFLNGLKERTRVVGLFPSEESHLRLVTGVLIEISETWETGKTYLTPS